MQTFGKLVVLFIRHRVNIHHPINFVLFAGILVIFLYSFVITLNTNEHQHYLAVFAQVPETTNQIANSFKMLNNSSPLPPSREMILTDEILALSADIDTIKNASTFGDFDTVYNMTLEVVEGANWGNISADLLSRKDLVASNNFVTTLETLNSLSKNTTQHTQGVNDTIIRESNKLVTDYGKVLDALAFPIFDVPKIITNLLIPVIIVVIIIMAIPKIRRKYKIRY